MTEHLSNPGCTRCPLSLTATHVCILGDGPLDGELLLLGIAPGEREDHTGMVFQSKSGRLLRTALFENGLYPRMENIVRCKSPDTRDPNKSEIDACRMYLEGIINEMPNLKYVVALGTIAMKWCNVEGSVMKLAGIPRKTKVLGKDIILIPIMHPAGLMRRPQYHSTWASHWHQIREIVHPSPVPFVDKVDAKLYPNGLEGKDWRTL